jgi:formylglycine-generating enzyme required for sulfatase activity
MLGTALFILFAGPQASAAAAPPGLILVRGGKTTIGSRVEEIEPLVRANEELRYVLAGETPQHTVNVPDFYLMPTEVTNEQFAVFVEANQEKPPRSWGVRALQKGQLAFLEEQSRAKREAKAQGLPFEAQLFDADRWWNEHWKESGWEIPSAERTNPVVFVNHAEARKYARWAGLRLMSEFEFQRAGREGSARTYPWGDEWDDKKYCQSLHSGRDVSMPVGSFPAGASSGIYDLAGNVWEWTASPFEPFPGYRNLKFPAKRREIECLAPFDPEQAVTVSGSFQMDKVGVRLTTRKNTDRSQSTNALGFRCAASVVSGADAAQAIAEADLELAPFGDQAVPNPSAAVALRRWTSLPGHAEVPGYALITGYQQLLACPASALEAATSGDLDVDSRARPQFVGFLALPVPALNPALSAGVHMVRWRAAGRVAEGSKAELEAFAGFRADQDCFLFHRADGSSEIAVPAPPLQFVKAQPCALTLQAAPAGDGAEPRTMARVILSVPSTNSPSKSFLFELPLEFAESALGTDWR